MAETYRPIAAPRVATGTYATGSHQVKKMRLFATAAATAVVRDGGAGGIVMIEMACGAGLVDDADFGSGGGGGLEFLTDIHVTLAGVGASFMAWRD